ncbi:MAG: hypothetical protein U9Q82_13990 [Chloroflexota bacterium]|nr:hypothetical protein [Chloroflexota bacterium]
MSINTKITNRTRACLGLAFGFILIFVAIKIFTVNPFDFNNMRRGTQALLSGINPWDEKTRISNFYNPPFSVLFLWPLLLLNSELILAIGASLLFAFIFYHKAWVSLSVFASNLILWLIAAGGIDLYVMGAGLVLLSLCEDVHNEKLITVLRVLAYGFLLVKPQGGLFIVLIYIFTHKDWTGLLISLGLYGLLFLPLYPDWVGVILTDPPMSQDIAAKTLWGKFGPILSLTIAIWIILSRRWKYWQLGGALAGILAPYGMTGIPTLLTLSAVDNLIAIPIFIIYSACLAMMTWISPPPEADYYSFLGRFTSIYHLGTFSLALILACYSGADNTSHKINWPTIPFGDQ